MSTSLLSTKKSLFPALLIIIYIRFISLHLLYHWFLYRSLILTILISIEEMDSLIPASAPSSSFVRNNTSVGQRDQRCSAASQLAERIICAILGCVFAIVGSFVGAVTGALIGLATESGLFRGAGIGAISGAVFSIEVVESSVTLWHSSDSGIWSILYVMDVITSLLSGRLVREKVGPAVQSAVQSQMIDVDTSPFTEALDIFDTGSAGGMSKDSLEKLGKMEIAGENGHDASGERIGCSVCLQEFQVGDTARSLPGCGHIFHLPCIDSWLVRSASCPLCRRDI